jgi:hypothetical protein
VRRERAYRAKKSFALLPPGIKKDADRARLAAL